MRETCVSNHNPGHGTKYDRRHLVVVCNLCIDQPWLMIVTGSHRSRPHLNHSTMYVKKFQTVNNLLAYKITQI